LLVTELSEFLDIFTPRDPQRRGCQLSVKFKNINDIDALVAKLKKNGVVLDARKPNVIRIAPTPLYNSFTDVFVFVSILKSLLLSSDL
jgi:kynureninase